MKKGQPAWNKGRTNLPKHTEEWKQKMREKRMERKRKFGYINSPEAREKMKIKNIGKKRSQETRDKISKNNAWRGKSNGALEAYMKEMGGTAGENNPNWKGGVATLNQKIRGSQEYKLWRKAVFERDDFTCIWCGQRGGVLNADHIKPFSQYPELRFAIDNGRTLCEACHKTTDTYGWKLKKYAKN